MGLTWDKTNLAEIYWNKGKAEGKIDIAKQMLLKGYPINDIHELTGLPVTEIKKMKDQ
ncbi:hypothetical protein [Anaerobacillus alkaliphilus]|uniref:hypothetical protein n=1 Tax=Anaerobacillus alkaliphilus TaxID=1548597 RepID=UPI00137628BD|nr:hypothetical protein [Anaerobacillus alkaliphilus]